MEAHLRVKRYHVRLVKDAYPSIFQKQTKYLSQQSVAQRNQPSKWLEVLQDRDEQAYQAWYKDNSISSFDQFSSAYLSKADSANWISVESKTAIKFLHLNSHINPRVVISFSVHFNITVTLIFGMRIHYLLNKNRQTRSRGR